MTPKINKEMQSKREKKKTIGKPKQITSVVMALDAPNKLDQNLERYYY